MLKEKCVQFPKVLIKSALKKSEDHQRAYLASRLLFYEAKINPESILHHKNGKPYTVESKYISIAHTKCFAAISLGINPMGIDIEQCQPRIILIAKKFLHQKEHYALETENPQETLTLIWAAKEAIYKLLSIDGLKYSEQIIINKFQYNSTCATAQVKHQGKEKRFQLCFRYFSPNHVAVVAHLHQVDGN